MAKDPSPLLGYNNNIRHKNRVFHVQTEDSGIRHPHIITHLFMDGGRILKSVKTSYSEHVGAEKMADVVRAMMKDQHKSMLIALRDGQFDHLVEAGEAKQPTVSGAAAAAAKSPKAPPVQPPKVPSAPAAKAASVRPPRVESASPKPGAAQAAPRSSRYVNDDSSPATARTQELQLDSDPLLVDSTDKEDKPLFEPQSDLPPPPASMFKDKGTGTYRSLKPGPAEESRPLPRSSRPPPRRPTPMPPSRHPLGAPPPLPKAAQKSSSRPDPRNSSPPTPNSEGRYAPARPAAIFGQTRPNRGSSIFGEDLISDKSLDEVILSYLAEDLDAPSEKKK